MVRFGGGLPPNTEIKCEPDPDDPNKVFCNLSAKGAQRTITSVIFGKDERGNIVTKSFEGQPDNIVSMARWVTENIRF